MKRYGDVEIVKSEKEEWLNGIKKINPNFCK